MHGFVQKVRRHVLDNGLIEPGQRVVAAVSGGADSVSMLRALLELKHDVVAAHVDHQTRPGTKDEASFVASVCRELSCAFVSLTCDPGRGSEDELRRGRYAALATVPGDRLATAHTLNDQAETVLLRMLRGAGTAGLAGIPHRAGRIVRPLLCVTRSEVMAYLEHCRQDFVEDPTNASLDPLRNRVRHVLLPLLEAEFQPTATRSLARLADAARADRAALEHAARRHLDAHGLDLEALRAVPKGMAAHVLRCGCEVPITFERMQAIFRLMEGRGGPVQLEGGVTAVIDNRPSLGLPNPNGRLVFTSDSSAIGG